VVGVGFAAGQSGGGDRAKPAADRAVPACALAGKPVARPADLPEAVLPPRTVLTSLAHPLAGMTLVTGVVSQEFSGAVDFFVTKLPAAGYRIGPGDAEMGEAEALFTGPNLRGKWKVNGIPNCPGAVSLALYVRR
jgi:hypothetical protein